MSFMTAKSFIFGGKSSTDYNLMIAWVGSSNIDVSENGLNLTLETTNNKTSYTSNVYGVQNEKNIIFNISVVKDNCTDPTGEFTRLQSMQVNEWLTSSPTFQLLAFNDNEPYSLHYYAICTQINDVIVGGRLVGKELRFETNSPFAFSDKVKKEFEVNGTKLLHISNNSHSNDNIIYPMIMITTKSEAVIIENMTDKNSVTINTENIIADPDGYKHIKLDSYNLAVKDNLEKLIPVYKLGWNDTYQSYISADDSYTENIYWVRFLKGMNEIKITGDCKIRIEYESPRKAGCL